MTGSTTLDERWHHVVVSVTGSNISLYVDGLLDGELELEDGIIIQESQITSDDSEIVFARHCVAVAARSANLLALDTPYFEFKNNEGLKADVGTAKSIGFTGKFAIHPDQIEAINNGFIPSTEEIEYSKHIVNEYQKAVKLGKGAIGLDGLVIDVPVVKRAQAVIDMLDSIRDRE